ncbi:MAG TPA: Ig-like domain-containing protein [Gemmataceae bacterium]|nr:Ig-like domain-containing protein [Gemmataceae bacterium]
MYETAGTFTAAVTIAHESAPTTTQTSTVNVAAGTSMPINHVDFETNDFSQTAAHLNGTIVNSPALDGMFSLELLRNNSPAWAEIRQSGTSSYSVANAGYSFLFQYASQIASQAPDSGIVNFQDTASNYMAAIHLSPDGKLVFYDQAGMHWTGTTKLIPNQTYLISAKILLNPSPNSMINWEVELNGLTEMSGTGSFNQYGQPNGSIKLGGNNPYRTNFVYDDVCVQDLGQDPGTSTSLTASPATPVTGQPVTLTATIAPSGPGTPTGTVSFFDTINNVMTELGVPTVSTSGGVTTATVITTRLATGTHTITANYGGGGNFTPSWASLTLTVNQASTSTAVTASANPSVSGQSVTFTATVTINAPAGAGAGYPSGTVIFSDNGTSIGQGTLSTAGGITRATFSTSALRLGSHPITASYVGDSNFTSSVSAPLPVSVQQPVPSVLAPSNQMASEGWAKSLSLGSFSEVGSGPWTTTVAWGDGTSTTLPAPSGPGSLANYSHTYAEEGTYTVTVTVTDTGANTSGTATFTVNVLEVALTIAPVSISPAFAVPFSGAVATFTDPGGAEANDGTHYSATINWGDGTGTATGSISVSGGLFTVNGTHTYAAASSYTVTVTIGHEGWMFAVQSPAAVNNFVAASMVKPTSFWEGGQGQQLIRRFGLTSSNQTLGQWLATTFPNLYGGVGGAPNVSIFTNSQIGSYYQSLFLSSQGSGLDVEILDTALDLFTTTSSLGGTVGQSYGFTVNSYGLGAYSWNIASSGAAFGTPNDTVLNVFQILLAANNNASGGEPWGSNTFLRNEALSVFQGINAV